MSETVLPATDGPGGTVSNHPLPAGAFFLRNIHGWTGRSITAMQGFVRGGSFWTHAGLILDGGWYIQGQPRGAKLYPIARLFDGQPLLVSDAPVQALLASRPEAPATTALPGLVRSCVVREGRALDGADYSYLDYPVLGLAEWARLHPHSHLLNSLAVGLRHYVNSSGHLICSALVDRAFLNSGIHLFDDGRMPGDVTPEDLAEYAYADGRRPLIDTRENPW